MSKNIISITKKMVNGNTETIDLSNNETMTRIRVEHLAKEIDKLGFNVPAEKRNRILSLVDDFKKRKAERDVKIFQLQQEDRKDYLDSLEAHLAILKEE